MSPDIPTPVAEVVVRTTRLPTAPGDAAFSVTPIDPVQLRTQPRLDDALASVPGAALFRRTSSAGANPTTQGMSLRAIAPSGAGRALVTLDGVPQNDPFGGWVIWTALPTEEIGAAAIVRGAGAGPYGAGALTGVVTLDSLSGNRTQADLSAGSLGQRRASAALSRDLGRADILIGAADEHSDGWVPVRQFRGAADTALTLDARSAALRLQTDAGAAVVSARASAYQESRSSGVAGANSRARGATVSLTLADVRKTTGWRVQGWATRSDLYNASVAVAAGRVSTTPANTQYQTPATGWGLNAAWRGGGEAASWEVGGDVRADAGESRERFRYLSGAFTRTREAGGREMVGGVYAEGERTIGPWLVTGGARIDHWSNSAAKRIERDAATGGVILDNHPPDRAGWAPTARAGLRRDLGSIYARAAAYSGFRLPTLNELHRPFRVGNDITEANPALSPETLYGVEAAVGGAAWSATAFYNVLKNPVTNVTIASGPGTFPIAGFVPAGGALRMRENAGRIDAYGLEAEGHADLSPDLALHVALALTHAVVDGGSAAPQLTGLRPAQAPQVRANAGLRWRPFDRLTLSGDVAYEGARFDDDINTRRLAPAMVVDARAAWAVAPTVEVYVAADNLLDARVATAQTADSVTSYGPPRSVRLGVSLRR